MELPVVYSRIESGALGAYVRSTWSVGDNVRCTFFHSGENDCYRIETDLGRYVLRVYRSRFSTAQILDPELSLLLELRTNGLPVSAPLPDRRDGYWNLIHAPEGDRAVTLFEFAEGCQLSRDSMSGWDKFGEELAKLHQVKPKVEGLRHHTLDSVLHAPTQRWHDRARQLGGDKDRVLEISEFLDRGIAQVWSALPTGVVHGDTAGWNAHVAGESLTWFDFLWTGIGPFAWDIATFRRGVGSNQEIWDVFKGGYQRVRNWTEYEEAAIPYLAAIRCIYVTSLIFDECDFDSQGEASVRWLDSRLDELNRLVAKIDAC